ncbi:hypothetical protein L9F63_024820, partial [Diploptera punctata]
KLHRKSSNTTYNASTRKNCVLFLEHQPNDLNSFIYKLIPPTLTMMIDDLVEDFRAVDRVLEACSSP